MSTLFFDSSAIAKHYVSEVGSMWVSQLLNLSAQNEVHFARISGVEVVAAITKRIRMGNLLRRAGMDAITQFRADFEKIPRIVEISPRLIARAMDLAERHALRGYDAVQLAAALIVNDGCRELGFTTLLVVSADEELNIAASAEGLQVENPNVHP
jgi:hypothetical protein